MHSSLPCAVMRDLGTEVRHQSLEEARERSVTRTFEATDFREATRRMEKHERSAYRAIHDYLFRRDPTGWKLIQAAYDAELDRWIDGKEHGKAVERARGAE